jgi:lysophospholipase L1-like esterase
MLGLAQIVANQAGRIVFKSTGSAYSIKLDNNWLTLGGTGVNNGDWFGDTANRDNVTIGGGKITAEMTFFKGLIAEIISYNTDLSTPDLTKVENYLSNKYGDLSQQMAVIGDSVTTGVGASDIAHSWANLVAINKGWRLHNGAHTATMLQNTVQNAVATLGAAAQYNGRDAYIERLLAYKGAKIFILYGLNDLRLNDVAITVALYENDLTEIVDGLIAGGVNAQDIIIGSPSYMNPATYGDGAPWNAGSTVKHVAYAASALAVATAKGTKYKDIYQYMIDNGGNTLLDPDGMHPNDAGHAAIATAFLSVI